MQALMTNRSTRHTVQSPNNFDWNALKLHRFEVHSQARIADGATEVPSSKENEVTLLWYVAISARASLKRWTWLNI